MGWFVSPCGHNRSNISYTIIFVVTSSPKISRHIEIKKRTDVEIKPVPSSSMTFHFFWMVVYHHSLPCCDSRDWYRGQPFRMVLHVLCRPYGVMHSLRWQSRGRELVKCQRYYISQKLTFHRDGGGRGRMKSRVSCQHKLCMSLTKVWMKTMEGNI